jgi:hypothetical protein
MCVYHCKIGCLNTYLTATDDTNTAFCTDMGDTIQFDDLFVVPGTTWDPLPETASQESTVTESSTLLGVDDHMWDNFLSSPAPAVGPSDPTDPHDNSWRDFLAVDTHADAVDAHAGVDAAAQVVTPTQLILCNLLLVVASLNTRDVTDHTPEYFMFNTSNPKKPDEQYIRIQEIHDTIIVRFREQNKEKLASRDPPFREVHAQLDLLMMARRQALCQERQRLTQAGHDAQRMRIGKAMDIVVRQVHEAQARLGIHDGMGVQYSTLGRRLLKPAYQEHWNNPAYCLFLMVQHCSRHLSKDA